MRVNLTESWQKRNGSQPFAIICYDLGMIGSLKGQVTLKTDKYLILDVAGVGYKVNVSPEAMSKVKMSSEAYFFIHTHVREDSLELYGFLDREELGLFEMLINVSGIGPKSAVALLGVVNVETLKKAVGSGDIAYLTKVSGIGKKTAEKIIIELRDKMEIFEGGALQEEIDTLEALKSLGYSQNEARDALKKIPQDLPTNTKIKEALKILGGK